MKANCQKSILQHAFIPHMMRFVVVHVIPTIWKSIFWEFSSSILNAKRINDYEQGFGNCLWDPDHLINWLTLIRMRLMFSNVLMLTESWLINQSLMNCAEG